jgi:hypothetical protein
MVEWPYILLGGGGLILSLSILDLGLAAHVGERHETEFGRFWRNFGERSEGKIKADPPKGRYVLVCTSFFVETPSKVRDWWEISRRLVPRRVPVNGGLLWRPRLISVCNQTRVSTARAVLPLSLRSPA